MTVFNKSIKEIDLDDLRRLVADEIPEGGQMEYKKALPATLEDPDPWMSGHDRIGRRARDRILAEITAFANAHGGTLIIGVEESHTQPARAAALCPLPRCRALAEKFRICARDCISPQLPEFRTIGVETDQKGNGLVILRVPRSRLAPHRLEQTKECYIRRADRCEKMSMREIQDVTLHTARQSVEGLWTITFSEQGKPWMNGGIMVLDSGFIFGGDSHFYYEGRYELVEDHLRGEIRALHYQGKSLSPFGDETSLYTMTLAGIRAGSILEGQCTRPDLPSHPLSFQLTRRAHLP